LPFKKPSVKYFKLYELNQKYFPIEWVDEEIECGVSLDIADEIGFEPLVFALLFLFRLFLFCIGRKSSSSLESSDTSLYLIGFDNFDLFLNCILLLVEFPSVPCVVLGSKLFLPFVKRYI